MSDIVFMPPLVRRRRAHRRTAVATPVVVNQITSVVYGPEADTLVLTVSGTLLEISNPAMCFEVEIEEAVYAPVDVTIALPQVTLTFETDVSSATTWSVPVAASWTFAEGTLAPPLSGAIG